MRRHVLAPPNVNMYGQAPQECPLFVQEVYPFTQSKTNYNKNLSLLTLRNVIKCDSFFYVLVYFWLCLQKEHTLRKPGSVKNSLVFANGENRQNPITYRDRKGLF